MRSCELWSLGSGSAQHSGPQLLRSVSAVAARAIRQSGSAGVLSLLALELPDSAGVSAAIEGHLLGGWAYQRAGGAPSAARTFTVAIPDDVVVPEAIVARARLTAGATNWVRQLVESPPNLLGPVQFADAVERLAREVAPGKVTVKRWGVGLMAERGFGGTLGVGAGSATAPLVIELSAGSGIPLGLAGKGITFDSGGINLKRSASDLSWMKSDMAAAASIAAAVVTSAALGSMQAMHAILPVAENMPGAGAQRPGDVVTHPGGRTTEITDTDNEGRLVLADAIAWLASTAPVAIIDVGTLTDSGAVGTEYWGCWTTAPLLAAAVVAAGERAGDNGWILPLHDSYDSLISSRVADVANSPLDVVDTGQLAAIYLRGFAGSTPWVHVDNGSGAWLERDSGAWAAGPTGTPLRALIEYLAPSV